MTGDAPSGTGAVSLEIATRSGGVYVEARPVARPEVIAGSAVIGPDGVVESTGSDRIEIACPEGTDVVIGASSGRVECRGRLGRVAVTGHSGRISVESAREVEVRSSSGRVTIGSCAGTCRVAVKSGRVRIGSAASIDVTLASGGLDADAVGDALVRAGSGRVNLDLVRAGSVDVSTVSGRVRVSVPPGVAPDLQLVSRSGRVSAEVEDGADGRVVIETSSGSIKVIRG